MRVLGRHVCVGYWGTATGREGAVGLRPGMGLRALARDGAPSIGQGWGFRHRSQKAQGRCKALLPHSRCRVAARVPRPSPTARRTQRIAGARKDAPEDLAYLSGFNGQKVVLIPSLDLVIVRLGVSDEVDWNHLFKTISEAFSESK